MLSDVLRAAIRTLAICSLVSLWTPYLPFKPIKKYLRLFDVALYTSMSLMILFIVFALI